MTRFGPESVIFAIALGARLLPALLHGSFTGNYGYDASVYYASADAFVHGRMPYRDFVLLHPPGVMLVDSPFAILGNLTDDAVGFAANNLFFAVLGALSAVLVVRVARRLGLPRRAALVGGVVYALWFGSIGAEYEARLEPLGCALVLCGLLAMLHAQDASRAAASRRAGWLALLSGLAFGAAVSVKIWWIVPVLLVIAWQAVIDGAPRRALRMAVGAVVAGLVIDLPFFVIAGHSMWRMVVLDQLGRPVNDPSLLRRFSYLTLGPSALTSAHGRLVTGAVIAGMIGLLLCLRAWRIKTARIAVVLFVVQVVELARDPSFFGFYADFLTVSLSLVVAAAVAPSPKRAELSNDPLRVGWWAPIAAVAMALVLYWAQPLNLIRAFPGSSVSAAATPYRCVITDSPMPLIDANLLSRDLHNGCPDLVDVTGLEQQLLRNAVRPAEYDKAIATWNSDLLRYLRSGNAWLLMRAPTALHLSRPVVKAMERDGMIGKYGNYRLYRVKQTLTPPEG